MKFIPKFSKRPVLLKSKYLSVSLALLISALFYQCSGSHDSDYAELPPGDPDNGGLFLPEKFEAVVVVDSLKGRARHIAVDEDGDVYVKLRFPDSLGGNAALRDTNNDGKADIIKTFADYEDKTSYGTGMRIHNGYLYYSSVTRIFRQRLTDDLVPDTEIELLLTDTHPISQHQTKPVAFDTKGNMYTAFGAPSDVCQEEDRTPSSPGIYPCPTLESRAGIWKFDASKRNQFLEDGEKYATGLRSVVGLEWNYETDALYAVVHGRDYLHNTWPHLFSPWQGAVLPSEVFVKLDEGADAGWPYHYYDHLQEKYFLNPEYGGDGKKQGEVEHLVDPVVGFPGHFAPNDLLFYTGDQFPERYKNGAFIAFHGSTSSAPYPQSGYFIGFVPFENGKPSGPWEVFADGFAGVDTVVNTSDADYRPMGLSQGPDGSLYIGETEKGKIWRVMYKGDKEDFGEAELAKMKKRKEEAPNIKTPEEYVDIVQSRKQTDGDLGRGAELFNKYCAACHQRNGEGNDRFPPLNESEWVVGDKERVIRVVLEGLKGEIEVKGKSYNNVMPQMDFLKDEEVAQVLTYIRQNFGNDASAVTAEEVKKVRSKG